MLVSPHFLFRIERDPNPTDPAKVHPISDVELASRLSYFLWSSMPDDELLGLAEAGKLRAPGMLDAQVKRMLADPALVGACRQLRRPVAGTAQSRRASSPTRRSSPSGARSCATP